MLPDVPLILKHDFDKNIRFRGKSLYKGHAVRMVDINEREQVISGMVIGSQVYKQIILYSNDGKRIEYAECSCPYDDNCKHQVALLLALEDKSGKFKNKEKASNKKSKELSGFEKPIKGTEFVKIPSTDIYHVQNRYCKTRTPEIFWRSKFSIVISEDYHLLISVFQPESSWTREMKLASEVTIKTSIDNEFYIKCSVCNKKSKYLCKHAHLTLKYLDETESADVLESPPLYLKELIQRSAESMSLSVKQFNEHFIVGISGGYSTILAKNNNVVLDTENYIMIGAEKQRDQQAVAMSVKKKLKESEISYALEWLHNDLGQIVIPIQGKARKSDDVIKSKLQEVKNLRSLSPKLGKLYKQILEFEMDFMSQDLESIVHQKVHALLTNNIDFLTRHNHYYYPLRHYYHSYKKKVSEYKHFKFSPLYVDIKANVTIQNGLYVLNFIMSVDGDERNTADVSFYNPFFLVFNQRAYLFKSQKLYVLFREMIVKEEVAFLPNDKTLLIQQIAALKEIINIDIDADVNIDIVTKDILKKSIYLSRQDDAIFLDPKIQTESNTVSILDSQFRVVKESIIEYNVNQLNEFLDVLKSLHPDFAIQLHEYEFLFLDINQFVENLWFYEFYQTCKENDIEIFGQENLSDLNYSKSKASINSSISSGIDWFDVNVDMSFGEQIIKPKSWIKAIKSNQRFIKLDDGSLGIIPEDWFEKLRKIQSNAELVNGELKISKYNFNVIDDLFDTINDAEIVKEVAEKRAKVNSIHSINTSENRNLPKGIKATLRPYQLQGYNWLRFLNDNNFGGILADDMGLGKTLQVICILAYAIEQEKKSNLVVVPRSLLFNWSKEIEKFAPKLKYLIHHGPKREKKDVTALCKNEIIISTYDTVALDILLFKEIEFGYVVLDESQSIKNPNSKRYKAMRLLNAQYKLTMTGTPIENNTFDLYAQLSFVNPGCLGSTQAFKERFSTPIDSKGDEEVAQMLRRLIFPFLLRRTKQQVASDLPEKTESIIYCEMASDQRKKYEQLKLQIKSDVYKLIEKEGLNRSRFKILEGLLRLRQMCNSPQILLPDSKDSSAKLNTIEEFLTGDLADKNVLIFSQFVSMLGLIKQSLDKLKISYAYLDGQTKNREKAVSEFTDNDSCSVFLISLKAGNTGLNLTKADYVFIVDPWWNPAVEAQAIDRTHRIGQDKQVFAYRLICKDTIEERIMELKEKKRKVAKDIIQVDDKIFKSMGKDQILNLFE